MINAKLSYQILILGYALLAGVFLVATVNNSLDNFTGNRNIISASVLGYLIFMLAGLYKFTKIFSWLSSGNFIVGTLIVFYVLLLTNFHFFYISIFMLALLGSLLSIYTAIRHNGK